MNLNIVERLPEEFSTMALEKELLSKDTNGQATRLLSHMPLAYILREAAKRHPDRVQRIGEIHSGLVKWRLCPSPEKFN